MIHLGWLAGLLLVWTTTSGWAQSASEAAGVATEGVVEQPCPGDRGESLPSSKFALDKLQDLVRAEDVRCAQRPSFQAMRGAISLALGNAAEAASHLERALMLDPEFAGAAIDYAQALALLGDLKAAEALLTEILERKDVPGTLRKVLENQLMELRQRASLTLAATAALRTGFDTNLNSAPYRDLLTLTLPGGETALLLSPEFRSREGDASVLDLGFRASRIFELSGSGLSISADLKLRHSADFPTSNFTQGDVQIMNSIRANTGLLLLGAGSSIVSFSKGGQFLSAYASLGHQWPLMFCRPRVLVNFEDRRFSPNDYMNGRYFGLMANAVCISRTDRLSLTARSGADNPIGDRPGAVQIKSDIRLNWVRRIWSGTLDIDLTWMRQLDERGYSPLLENFARRTISRYASRTEISWPIMRKWDSFIAIENNYQASNLELFQIKGRAVYIGLRWVGYK